MEIKNIIDEAIRNGRTITIKYQKYGGEYSERTISNIQPSEEFGEGYIKAYCHLRQEDRTFKISRIISVSKNSISKNGKGSPTIKNESYEGRNGYSFLPTSAELKEFQRQMKSIMDDSPFEKSRKEAEYLNETLRKSYNEVSNHQLPKPKQKEGCYIATMVYGDYDHPQVVILRDFRDKVLLSNSLGTVFVRLYYWLSPKLVKILKDHRKTNVLIRKSLDNLIKVIK